MAPILASRHGLVRYRTNQPEKTYLPSKSNSNGEFCRLAASEFLADSLANRLLALIIADGRCCSLRIETTISSCDRMEASGAS